MVWVFHLLSHCSLLLTGVAPHCSTDTQPKVIFAAAGAAGSLARDERHLQQAVNKPSQAAAHLGRLHANFKLLISSWSLFLILYGTNISTECCTNMQHVGEKFCQQSTLGLWMDVRVYGGNTANFPVRSNEAFGRVKGNLGNTLPSSPHGIGVLP